MHGPWCSSKERATRLRSRPWQRGAAATSLPSGSRSCRSAAPRRSDASWRRSGLEGRLALAGLYDAGEEGVVRRGLERAGLDPGVSRDDLEQAGFYVCVEDLEDELIRALGADRVEEVVGAQGDLAAFRTLQKQPAWRGRPTEEQLRRFMGSGGRRKLRYARLLVETLDLDHLPRPLDLGSPASDAGSSRRGLASRPGRVGRRCSRASREPCRRARTRRRLRGRRQRRRRRGVDVQCVGMTRTISASAEMPTTRKRMSSTVSARSERFVRPA